MALFSQYLYDHVDQALHTRKTTLHQIDRIETIEGEGEGELDMKFKDR